MLASRYRADSKSGEVVSTADSAAFSSCKRLPNCFEIPKANAFEQSLKVVPTKKQERVTTLLGARKWSAGILGHLRQHMSCGHVANKADHVANKANGMSKRQQASFHSQSTSAPAAPKTPASAPSRFQDDQKMNIWVTE